MKKLTILALLLFALGSAGACDSSSPKEAEAPTVLEVPDEEPAPQAAEEPQLQNVRPDTARNLEQRFREEAAEQINADNVDSIMAELEKEIEAELAELND